MKLIKIFALAIILSSCKSQIDHRNTIAFSCIKCGGCVVSNLNFIKSNDLHKKYKIIIDTMCYENEMGILKSIRYEQMSNEQIEKTFGRFGNMLLIDSNGKKIEFLTDMHIKDYNK